MAPARRFARFLLLPIWGVGLAAAAAAAEGRAWRAEGRWRGAMAVGGTGIGPERRAMAAGGVDGGLERGAVAAGGTDGGPELAGY